MNALHRLQTKITISLTLMLTLFGIGLGLSSVGTVAAAGQSSFVQNPTATGEFQFPTETPTVIGGPTATPSRTPTITPVLVEAIGEANLRSGPGLDFDIVGKIVAGNPVPVIGRSIKYPWMMVAWEEAPSGEAWVFEQLVRVIGDITTVPVVDEPELPTLDPTEVIIQQTATVLLQTPGAAETAAVQTAFFAPTGITTQTPDQAVAAGGFRPTFTPPAELPPVDAAIPTPVAIEDQGSGISPAVVIASLGLMGMLILVVGLVRRILLR